MNPNEQEKSDYRIAYIRASDLGNLGVIAPHKKKIYGRYTIDWLISRVDSGANLKYATFWKADDGCENNMLSQWYSGSRIAINGRYYDTAEQYMMSEKALLFGDIESYRKIMEEPDPAICKKLGRNVKGFNPDAWDKAFREIIFHGNIGKLQSNIEVVDALLSTENAVLIEASPFDDIYGAGMEKHDLLNLDGTLKVKPDQWHKAGSTKQAENHLGFVLMAIRDLFWQLMGFSWFPGEDQKKLSY